LPKYKDWAMYDEWLSLNVWRFLLDDHMGPFPWTPRLKEKKGCTPCKIQLAYLRLVVIFTHRNG